MRHIFSLILFFALQSAFAQNTGTIKGNLKDDAANEAIIGATILLKGTSLGGSTDIDGNFQITNIPEGKYTVVITSVGYDTKEVENVEVPAGKIVIINTSLNPENNNITGIEIVARKETGTSIAVIAEIKEAEQVAVGIGSEQIQKSQDKDAAQVLRRIPGVSLQENRFAIIRGLPQRYNAVLINDIYAPSTEVDSRAFSFDLVPSNMIDRVLIFKSGGPELPGDFAGGAVKIYTKNAPEENFANVSFGYGGRVGTTFNEVSDYQRSNTDFLGFDNGLRKLPSNFPSFLSNDLSAVQRAQLGANALSSDLAFIRKKIMPDHRFGFNLGRRFDKGRFRFGTLTSINYSNTHQYYSANQNSLLNDQITFPAQVIGTFKDDTYTNNLRLSALHNWSLSWNADNRIEFKNLFNQQSFRQSLIREGTDLLNNFDFRNFSQRFEQKSFYGGQITGKHKLNDERFVLTWATGLNYTNKQEPDWRRFNTNRTRQVGENNEPYVMAIPGSANLTDGRYFSNLNELAYSANVAVEQKIGKEVEGSNPMKLRYGFYTERKTRDFDARYFSYLQSPGADISPLKLLPLDQIFRPENINGTTGFTFAEGTSPIDSYKGFNTLMAGYVGGYIPLGKKMSVTPGVRTEYNIQELESLNLSGLPENADNRILSVLPSLNAVYNLSDKQLIRFAYSRTVNRPEFRELAPFNFYDFNLNADTRGNVRLKTATIDNADLRWEYYPSTSELISLGVFYKNFQNPVEAYLQNASAGGTAIAFGYGNAQSAQGYGVEAEVRKSFYNFTSSKFIQRMSIVANASYLVSNVNVGNQVDLGPSSSGLTDVDAPKNRTLVGQSPYLVNAGLYYNDEDRGFQVNVLYNVAGPRLYLVGNNNQPSLYEVPRNIIDFNISKSFLDKKWEARLSVQDVLNQKFKFLQDSNLNGKIDGQDSDFRAFRPGTTVNATVTYNF
ncbi:hypothetical protein AD998_12430 [bacterium 336/3]|nr:hypothetical protein AD998_12430 [bacterium 336/3]